MADKVLFRDQDGDTDEELSETNISEVLALTNISDYVDRGLGFTLDTVNDELDIGSGHAVVEDSNQAYHVLPDARTNLGLTGSTTNYVYLQADTSDGTVSYHIDTDDSPPTGTNIISLKVGEADTSADTTTEVNRGMPPEIQTTSVSSNYTTNGENIIFVDTSSSAITITLSSTDAATEQQIIIIDDGDNAATNNITVNTEGAETIDPDAESTKTIRSDGGHLTVWANGSNWDSDENTIATGTVTLSGGSTPALDTVLADTLPDQTQDYSFTLYVDSDPAFNADYAFNYDYTHQWDDSDSAIDIDLTVNWDTDPGGSNDVTARWEVFA